MQRNTLKICFIFRAQNRDIGRQLIQQWGQTEPDACDIFVVLGGDGSLLHAVHQHWTHGKPFYGLALGGVGALMNPLPSCFEALYEDIRDSLIISCFPLKLFCQAVCETPLAYAFNEISFYRRRYRAVKWTLSTLDQTLLWQGMGDGVILSTALGSTGYNASAGGEILPLDCTQTVITSLNPCGLHPIRTQITTQEKIYIDFRETNERPINISWDVFDELKKTEELMSFVVEKEQEACAYIALNSRAHRYHTYVSNRAVFLSTLFSPSF